MAKTGEVFQYDSLLQTRSIGKMNLKRIQASKPSPSLTFFPQNKEN